MSAGAVSCGAHPLDIVRAFRRPPGTARANRLLPRCAPTPDPYFEFLPADIRKQVEEWGITFALNYTYYMTRPFIPQHYFDMVRLRQRVRAMRIPLSGLLHPRALYGCTRVRVHPHARARVTFVQYGLIRGLVTV